MKSVLAIIAFAVVCAWCEITPKNDSPYKTFKAAKRVTIKTFRKACKKAKTGTQFQELKTIFTTQEVFITTPEKPEMSEFERARRAFEKAFGVASKIAQTAQTGPDLLALLQELKIRFAKVVKKFEDVTLGNGE